MKIENLKSIIVLKQYSALAGSLLATIGAANGQVIYTDIPDVTLNATTNPGEIYGLDLNNDGTVDYNFHAIVFGASNFIGAVMYPYYTSHLNAMAGNVETIGANFLGYPSALALNDNIDDNLNFFELVDLVNTMNLFSFPVMFSFSNGNPYGHWQGGVTDHYVGLKFSPNGTDINFGWARCDVAVDASFLTIKDYAYNATPNTSLLAGEGIPLGLSSAIDPKDFHVFVHEGLLTIVLNNGELDGTAVILTNMMGKTLARQVLKNNVTRIDLRQFAKGIYLVSLQKNEEVFSLKISW